MNLRLIMLAMMLVFVPCNVVADSDGSYCVGNNYVAVEARGIELAAEQPSVYIIHIDAIGILKKHVVITPTNNNKKLSCGDNNIILSDGYQIKDIATTPTLINYQAGIGTVLDFEESYLSSIKQSTAIKIPATNQSFFFTLVLSQSYQMPEKGLILNFLSARVVKTSLSGWFIESKLLAEGISVETID